jgi:hypothetical protein
MQIYTQDGKYHDTLFEMPKVAKKIDYDYQELGVRMQEYFGNKEASRIWSMFWKVQFPVLKVEDAFKICQQKGIKNINYLFGILKKL